MRLQKLKMRYEPTLAGLNIPEAFDVATLCNAIATRRGRKIQIQPLPQGFGSAADAPCGLWLATDSTDYIYFAASTVPVLRDHIICHELGHMMCSHVPTRLRPELLQALTADIRWSVASPALGLGRTSYSRPEEVEAEMIASLLRQRITRTRPRSGTSLDRIEESFG